MQDAPRGMATFGPFSAQYGCVADTPVDAPKGVRVVHACRFPVVVRLAGGNWCKLL